MKVVQSEWSLSFDNNKLIKRNNINNTHNERKYKNEMLVVHFIIIENETFN